MSPLQISLLRLLNQQVISPAFTKPADLVYWMGAVQAQDYLMAKWALGVRLPGSTDPSIEDAVDKGEIIRTHVMRPTWHFISRKDARWMIELTAPYILQLIKSRHNQLAITPELITKSNKLFEKALSKGHCTRKQLVDVLTQSKIRLDDNRAAHLLAYAELGALICSGARQGNELTYALFDERVPASVKLSKEEAAAKLADRYFTSHGPATLSDFVWWSGMLQKDAKPAIEAIKSEFVSQKIGEQTYYFKDGLKVPSLEKDTVYLLPAYDEFLISYKDRNPSLPLKMQSKTISINGIFKPLIVIDGLVAGIWKRTKQGKKIYFEAEFFKKPSAGIKRNVKERVKEFGSFLDQEVVYL